MSVKINRLLEIIIILLNKGTVSARELAERFNVSTRTIYRDIDVLSTSGVPIYTSKGNGGGISLLDGYSLNKTLISKHESESILFALKTLQVTKYPDADRMLEKIGALFKNTNSSDWIYVEFSPWGSKPNEHNRFNDIKKAILEQKVILFDYVNSQGFRSERKMEPIRLFFKGQAWYIWGFCLKNQDFRMFRISRIKNLYITDELFVRRVIEELKQDSANEESKKLVILKLRFQPEVLYRIFDDYDEELITRNSDGTCDVTTTFSEDEWVYGYIMSFGCYVKVLEPEHIQKIIAERMKKALEFYKIISNMTR